jgi:hypothetical protein
MIKLQLQLLVLQLAILNWLAEFASLRRPSSVGHLNPPSV